MKTRLLLAGLAAATMMAGAAQAATTVSYTLEAVGQKTSTATNLAYKGVETFSEIAPGAYASKAATFAGLPGVSGTYAGLPGGKFQVNNDGYGNDGNYGVTFNTAYGQIIDPTAAKGYSLTVSGAPVNYFGIYLESLDWSNTIQFYKGSTLVGEFDTLALAPSLNNNDQGSRFVNIFTGGTFDKIVFTEADTAQGMTRGFESDNHTLGYAAGGVPEPASWALMIAGFGGAGAMLRGRRKAQAATA